MKEWISNYIDAERKALDTIPVDQVADAIETVKEALNNDRQIFVFGNGGSAADGFLTELTGRKSKRIFQNFDFRSGKVVFS